MIVSSTYAVVYSKISKAKKIALVPPYVARNQVNWRFNISARTVGRTVVVDHVTRIDLPGRQWQAHWGNHSKSEQRMPCFIAGPENRLVVVAIQSLLNTNLQPLHSQSASLAQTNSGILFNPLVLLGPTGCGKSHLAGGIANHLHALLTAQPIQTKKLPYSHSDQPGLPADHRLAVSLTPEQTSLHDLLDPPRKRQYQDCTSRQVAYLSSAEFCHLYQQAREQNKLAEFRLAMAQLRLLVLEDLHRMRLRHEIQQELRLIIDKLLDHGAIVLVTSQQPITMIHSLEKNLEDRLAVGLTVRIKPLGTAAKLELLLLAADRCGTELDLNSAQQLAQQIEGSAPKLFQALALLEQQRQLEQPLTSSSSDSNATVSSCLDGAHHEPLSSRKHVSMRQIITVLSRYFSVSQHQLRGHSRRRSIVHARGVAVYLARLLTDLSYAQIGHHLGNRDHTTTMHAHRKLLQLLTIDLLTQECVDDLKRILMTY